MPISCSVVKCTNRFGREKKSFFRLPSASKHCTTKRLELKNLRRFKWLLSLRRSDLCEIKVDNIRICEDHFIKGKPADLLDIENPDWVPSVKMGYPTNEKVPFKATSVKLGYSTARKSFSTKRKNNGDFSWSPSKKKCHLDKPQNVILKSKNVQEKHLNDYASPCIEYLSTSVVHKLDFNKSAHQSSLKASIQEIVDQDSDLSEIDKVESLAYQYTSEDSFDENIDSPDENVSDEELSSEDENINSTEQIASVEELSILEKFTSCSKIVTSNKLHINEDTSSSRENDTDEEDFSKTVNSNMSSKKVQTCITMIDLDKLSNGYKASIAEVEKLKAKLNSLTKDILHLNEIYC